MAENKKYFWFKLKEDFFQSKEMKILRKMPSGSDMIVVLLKLQLHALKTNGIIEIDGLCNTTEEELSILIDEDTNLIKMSLMALNKFSLLNVVNEKDIRMLLHEELIGQETASTIRSRKSRGNKKIENKKETKLLQCNTNATKCNIDIDIDLNKDINIDLDTHEEIKLYSLWNEEQLKKIFIKYPNIDLFVYENKILEYEEKKNKKYKNYLSTLNTFVKNDENGFLKDYIKEKKQEIKQEIKVFTPIKCDNSAL